QFIVYLLDTAVSEYQWSRWQSCSEEVLTNQTNNNDQLSWQLDNSIYMCDYSSDQISWLISPTFAVLPNKKTTVHIQYIKAPNITVGDDSIPELQAIVVPLAKVSESQFCQQTSQVSDKYIQLKRESNIATELALEKEKNLKNHAHHLQNVEEMDMDIKSTPKLVYARLIIQNNRSCSQVNSVRIINTVCEKIIAEGAIFPESNPPSVQNGPKLVIGHCTGSVVANVSKPVAWCQPDGNWSHFINACRCPRGKERRQQYCVKCQINYYKPNSSALPCLPCPANTSTTVRGSVKCICNSKQIKLNSQLPCQPIPKCKVRFSSANTSSLIQVLSFGSRKTRAMTFRLQCRNCSVSGIQYNRNLKLKTRIKINFLLPNAMYVIKISPIVIANGKKYLKMPCATLKIKTKDGVPGAPRQVHVLQDKFYPLIYITWKPPRVSNGLIIKYRILCRRLLENHATLSTLAKEEIFVQEVDGVVQFANISHLRPRSHYSITISATTKLGLYGPQSYPAFIHIGPVISDDTKTDAIRLSLAPLIIGGFTAGAMLIAVLIVILKFGGIPKFSLNDGLSAICRNYWINNYCCCCRRRSAFSDTSDKNELDETDLEDTII
ncbi:Ephrin type-B receptor 3, partial [Trichoplax sp. H2]